MNQLKLIGVKPVDIDPAATEKMQLTEKLLKGSSSFVINESFADQSYPESRLDDPDAVFQVLGHAGNGKAAASFVHGS